MKTDIKTIIELAEKLLDAVKTTIAEDDPPKKKKTPKKEKPK